jgi:hypothetical protein
LDPPCIVGPQPVRRIGRGGNVLRLAPRGLQCRQTSLKLLAMTFGGDPACTDRNRVLRLPGFLNQKYTPAHVVTVE